jgi:steroid delta-isomerase
MSTEHYQQVVNDYIRLMTAGDWQGVAKLYAEDATVEDPVGTEPHRGIEAVAAFYRGAVANGVTLHLDGPVRVAGREVAFPFHAAVKADGKLMHIHVIDVFRFNDQGKIVAMRAFFGQDNFVPA